MPVLFIALGGGIRIPLNPTMHMVLLSWSSGYLLIYI